MKKLLLLLFIPIVCFGQEDIERFKIYDTSNSYISLKLDTMTGKTWMVQIGLGDGSSMTVEIGDEEYAHTLEFYTEEYNEDLKYWEEKYNSNPELSDEEKEEMKPFSLERRLESDYFNPLAKVGRFKLYPTNNMFNFIMLDVINGKTWQVQWSTEPENRIVNRIY